MGDTLEMVYVVFSAVVFSADVAGSDLSTERTIDAMDPIYHVPAGYSGDGKRLRVQIGAKFEVTESSDVLDDGSAGYHRKWVGELTPAEWHLFAESYLIELDDNSQPIEYDHILGTMTLEYGTIPAICVDVSEGWNSASCTGRVLSAQMYLSFMVSRDADPEEIGGPGVIHYEVRLKLPDEIKVVSEPIDTVYQAAYELSLEHPDAVATVCRVKDSEAIRLAEFRNGRQLLP